MEPNLKKWQNNSKMFSKIRKSIKSEFDLLFAFALYDPHGQLYVDDINDLTGCFLGHESHSEFVLSLDVESISIFFEVQITSIISIFIVIETVNHSKGS